MGDARSNFLRRKRELAKDAKRKKESTIATAVWLLEKTNHDTITYLRCSVCHYVHTLTSRQMERFEYPCMCPECDRYMLGVETVEKGEVKYDS